MDHRYGRHGPHAWLRWRKRHYIRRSSDLTPIAQVVVIHVQVPINAERIIIIMALPEGFDEEKARRELQIQSNFGETHPPYVIAEQQHELPDGLDAQANIAARKKALQDIANDPENLPSQPQVHSAAELSAYEHVERYIANNSSAAKEYDSFIRAFIKVFLAAYQKEIKAKQNIGVIFDDRTLHIRRVVRADKGDHLARGKRLSPDSLRYLATARAMRDLGLDTALSLEDLDKIHGYAEVYCPYYNQYASQSKEVGQIPGSGPF
jgi:hypothetical protein